MPGSIREDNHNVIKELILNMYDNIHMLLLLLKCGNTIIKCTVMQTSSSTLVKQNNGAVAVVVVMYLSVDVDNFDVTYLRNVKCQKILEILRHLKLK